MVLRLIAFRCSTFPVLHQMMICHGPCKFSKTKTKGIDILYRLKPTFSIDGLETLNTSLIASYISYGLPSWGSKSPKK